MNTSNRAKNSVTSYPPCDRGRGAMGTMLYSRGVFINRCFDS